MLFYKYSNSIGYYLKSLKDYLDKYSYKRISPGEKYEKWLSLSLTLKGIKFLFFLKFWKFYSLYYIRKWTTKWPGGLDGQLEQTMQILLSKKRFQQEKFSKKIKLRWKFRKKCGKNCWKKFLDQIFCKIIGNDNVHEKFQNICALNKILINPFFPDRILIQIYRLSIIYVALKICQNLSLRKFMKILRKSCGFLPVVIITM